MNFSKVIRHTRLRFWLYIIGPFLLWYTASIGQVQDFIQRDFFLRFIYFSIPANLLIYGINDIADYDTDKKNPKKQNYESLLTPDKQKTMRSLIAVTNIPFLIRAAMQWQYILLMLVVFRFFGIFYSTKPIRAKTIPFVDGIFNVLYIIPWFLGYFLWWWTQISRIVAIAWTLRCMAMHAYSAIPDIASDKKANLQTTATVLGNNWTLLYCLICRIIATILWSLIIGPIAIILWAIYSILIYLSRRKDIFSIYKRFPLINTLIGMFLFFFIFRKNIF